MNAKQRRAVKRSTTKHYILVDGETFPVDTLSQIARARKALTLVGVTQAPVYVGEGVDATLTSLVVFSEYIVPLSQTKIQKLREAS